MDPDPAFRPAVPPKGWEVPAPDPDTLDLFERVEPGAPADRDAPVPKIEPEAPDARAQVRRRAVVAASHGRRRTGPIERPRRGVTTRPGFTVVERERQVIALLATRERLSVEEIASAIGIGLVRARAILSNLCDAGVLRLTKRPPQQPSRNGRPPHLFSLVREAPRDG